ncbi:MAG: hypothetical protein AB2A00_15660 [Myxococcota bacterium]
MRAADLLVMLALGAGCRGADADEHADEVTLTDEEVPNFAYALATALEVPDFPVPLPADAKVLHTFRRREELAGSTIPPRTLERQFIRLLTTLPRAALKDFYDEKFPGRLHASTPNAAENVLLLHRNPVAAAPGEAEIEIVISNAIDGATQVVEIIHTRELPGAARSAQLLKPRRPS